MQSLERTLEYGSIRRRIRCEGGGDVRRRPPASRLQIFRSVLCRYPVALPALDIVRAVQEVQELQMNNYDVKNLGPLQRKMYATLMIRLAYKIRNDQFNIRYSLQRHMYSCGFFSG